MKTDSEYQIKLKVNQKSKWTKILLSGFHNTSNKRSSIKNLKSCLKVKKKKLESCKGERRSRFSLQWWKEINNKKLNVRSVNLLRSESGVSKRMVLTNASDSSKFSDLWFSTMKRKAKRCTTSWLKAVRMASSFTSSKIWPKGSIAARAENGLQMTSTS